MTDTKIVAIFLYSLQCAATDAVSPELRYVENGMRLFTVIKWISAWFALCSRTGGDLWQVVDMKMDSYMVCADLRQIVDMKMDSYMVCAGYCDKT